SGPVNDRPFSLAIRTNSAAASCSGERSGGGLRLVTSSSVAVIGCSFLARPQPSVSGPKHRIVDTPTRQAGGQTDHRSSGDDRLQQEMGVHLGLGGMGFWSHEYFLPTPRR